MVLTYLKLIPKILFLKKYILPISRPALYILIFLHVSVIIASNYLVQLPMTLFGWQTTWGAFSFPFIFLATDLTVRLIGKETARRVITGAMFFALIASYLVSVLFKDGMFQGWISLHTFNLFVARISLASFFAYVFGQLLDIHVFDHLRKLKQWWWAPIASTLFGSMLDSIVFFTIAFWHSPDPFMAKNWIEIASVDYVVKLSISMVLFIPLYGLLLRALARMFQKI